VGLEIRGRVLYVYTVVYSVNTWRLFVTTGDLASEGAKRVAAALGICVGISGLDHGFFEILQGNVATPGFAVHAIGPEQQMWVNGTEDAFTLVPNFLITGILAMLVGVAVIVWSIRFIDRPYGSRVFLLFGLLMFLVGGGVGMLVFLALGWAISRRINNPPSWWGSFPGAFHLAGSWRQLTGLGLVLYGVALEVAIAGYVPGVSDPDMALSICWGALLGMLSMFLLALFGAASRGRSVTLARAVR
jgi:hypothetical protein